MEEVVYICAVVTSQSRIWNALMSMSMLCSFQKCLLGLLIC